MLLHPRSEGADKAKTAVRKLAGTALLLVVLLSLLGLGWWFFQLSYMGYWQQALRHKLEPIKPEGEVSAPRPRQTVLISHLALPPVPEQDPIQTIRATLSSPVLKAISSPAPSTVANKAPSLSASLQAEKKYLKKQSTEPKPIQGKAQPSGGKGIKNQGDAQTVLEQLQTASGLDLQIALPENLSHREHLLAYLYRCSGVQFAVLQQQQLIRLSPKRYVATSQWLRLVSGSLSPQEKTWLGGYQGTPVRLFPQVVDQRLASHIATALQGQPLRSLRAQYLLTDSGLALNQIKLNQQVITTHWLLHQPQCA